MNAIQLLELARLWTAPTDPQSHGPVAADESPGAASTARGVTAKDARDEPNRID